MQGKTVLVTGATDGIGMQTALDLAQMGATVIVHGRDATRGANTVDAIRHKTGSKNVSFEQADFSSLWQVRALAANITARHARLDVLINNAGVSLPRRELSEDGFEMTFAVNHLAHFLLTHLLLDLLKAGASSRIVTVSSSAHRDGRVDFDDLQSGGNFRGFDVYSNTKLLNVMFSIELAERLSGTSVTSNCLHPGVIDTKMLRSNFPNIAGASLEEGVETSVFLATSPEVANVSGKYFSHRKIASHSSLADDPAARRRLWQISEQLCGIA